MTTPAQMALTYAALGGPASQSAGLTGYRPGSVPITTQQRRTGASLRLRCRSGLSSNMHAHLDCQIHLNPDERNLALILILAQCPAAGELTLAFKNRF